MAGTAAMQLTEEQERIVAAAGSGAHMKVKAFAGTGKTSTSVAMSERALAEKRGLYLAFNRAIADEAQRKMPGHIEAKTAHSLAYRATVSSGRFARVRLQRGMMPLVREIEDDALVYDAASALGGEDARRRAAMATAQTITRYCQSDREAPSERDVPRQLGAALAEKPRERAELFAAVAAAASRVWERLIEEGSTLPISHDVYLKYFCLGDPQLPFDAVLLDEAQDSNPVLVRLVSEQRQTQLVALGDTWQQIYAWRGALDAMKRLPGEEYPLTKSWRFGENIAGWANLVLRMLGETRPLVGGGPVAGEILDDPDLRGTGAVLCRGNSGVLRETLAALDSGRHVAVVGGTDEVVRLIEAAYEMSLGGQARHAELALFSGWDEFRDFSQTDEGAAYRPVVRVVEERGSGVPALCRRLKHEVTSEADAEVIVSTAHKAKGREWDEVRLSNDFRPLVSIDPDVGPAPELNAPEANLVYVSLTRAMQRLNLGGLGAVLRDDAARLGALDDPAKTALVANISPRPAASADAIDPPPADVAAQAVIDTPEIRRRARGDRLNADGKVRRVADGEFRVAGSGGGEYELRLVCGCADAAEGYTCKHAYAVLAALAGAGSEA